MGACKSSPKVILEEDSPYNNPEEHLIYKNYQSKLPASASITKE